MMSCLDLAQHGWGKIPKIAFCAEKNRLLQAFLACVHDLLDLQNQQTRAVINGEPNFTSFDILIHLAQEKKERAKYAWIAHVEQHHCELEESDAPHTS